MRLIAMKDLTGVDVPILSAIERGERFPRPRDLEGLTRGYGPQREWYEVVLEVSP